MRAKVSRNSLFSLLSHAVGIIDRRPTAPILSHILVNFSNSKLTVKATDLDHSITEHVDAQIEEDGAICIPAQSVFDIVKKIGSEAIVELSTFDQGRKVIIESGKSKFEVQSLPAEDFPKITDFQPDCQIKIATENLKRLIDLTKFAISTEETRYNLNGLYIHTDDENKYLKSAATDGHRLAVTAIESSGCNIKSGIFSRKTILEVRKLIDESIEEVELSSTENQVMFKIGDLILTARLIDGTFPNYSSVIPTALDKSFTVDRKAFVNTLDRVSVISEDKTKAIRLNLNEGILHISAINVTTGGSGKDEIIIKQKHLEQWDACFNAKYLLDVSEALNCETLKIYISGKLSPILIHPDNDEFSQFVVMPMRM